MTASHALSQLSYDPESNTNYKLRAGELANRFLIKHPIFVVTTFIRFFDFIKMRIPEC